MKGAEIYLGDGVFGRFDGYQIWIMTNEVTEIALEPYVMDTLVQYAVKKGYSIPTTKEK